jgi:hypothetical protein
LKRETPAKDTDARFQPLSCVRLMSIVWLAERRLVAQNNSLARQALEDAK